MFGRKIDSHIRHSSNVFCFPKPHSCFKHCLTINNPAVAFGCYIFYTFSVLKFPQTVLINFNIIWHEFLIVIIRASAVPDLQEIKGSVSSFRQQLLEPFSQKTCGWKCEESSTNNFSFTSKVFETCFMHQWTQLVLYSGGD